LEEEVTVLKKDNTVLSDVVSERDK